MIRALKASEPGTSGAYESLLRCDSPRTWSWCCRAGAATGHGQKRAPAPPSRRPPRRWPYRTCTCSRHETGWRPAGGACSTCSRPGRTGGPLRLSGLTAGAPAASRTHLAPGTPVLAGAAHGMSGAFADQRGWPPT